MSAENPSPLAHLSEDELYFRMEAIELALRQDTSLIEKMSEQNPAYALLLQSVVGTYLDLLPLAYVSDLSTIARAPETPVVHELSATIYVLRKYVGEKPLSLGGQLFQSGDYFWDFHIKFEGYLLKKTLREKLQRVAKDMMYFFALMNPDKDEKLDIYDRSVAINPDACLVGTSHLGKVIKYFAPELSWKFGDSLSDELLAIYREIMQREVDQSGGNTRIKLDDIYSAIVPLELAVRLATKFAPGFLRS